MAAQRPLQNRKRSRLKEEEKIGKGTKRFCLFLASLWKRWLRLLGELSQFLSGGGFPKRFEELFPAPEDAGNQTKPAFAGYSLLVGHEGGLGRVARVFRRREQLWEASQIPSQFPESCESGNWTRNLVPTPLCDSTSTWPRWFSTMCLTMAKPKPVPPSARERALSTR